VLARLGARPEGDLRAGVAEAIEMAVLEAPAAPLPGAAEALLAVAERYPVALICDTGFSSGRALRRLLARDGLLGCFRHLTFSDELGTTKPSARNFELTLDALGVLPAEAVHVGDLVETDIVGAKGAGMWAVLYWGEGREYADTAPADAVIRRHDELHGLLVRL